MPDTQPVFLAYARVQTDVLDPTYVAIIHGSGCASNLADTKQILLPLRVRMASKESDESRFQIHQIVLLFAAMAGGVWLYESSLKSSRPVTHDIENKSAVTSGADRVQARLWQDPFEAVETHVKSEESKNSGSSARGEIAHAHSLTLVAEEVARSTPTPQSYSDSDHPYRRKSLCREPGISSATTICGPGRIRTSSLCTNG